MNKPQRPTAILNLDAGCTARQYADHLNMMLTYHIELDKWHEARVRELEKELWVVAECIFQNVSASEMRHWAQGIKVSIQGDEPPAFTIKAAVGAAQGEKL